MRVPDFKQFLFSFYSFAWVLVTATLEAIPDPPKNINLVIFSCFDNDLQTFLPRVFSFRVSKSDLEAFISPTNRIYDSGDGNDMNPALPDTSMRLASGKHVREMYTPLNPTFI